MVELTPNQVAKLYDFIGELPPEEITEKDISQVLIEIEKKFTPFIFEKESVQNFNTQSNKNVLIIDDLEVSLYQLTKLLTKAGYNPHVARTVKEAKDLYKKQSINYIFLDLFLPEPEDGFQLLEEIKNMPKTKEGNVKVIVISGTDDKKLINQCFAKGADDFIGKTSEWHNKTLEKLRNLDEIIRGPHPEIKTIIEDKEHKIASIKVKNIFKPEVIDELKREAVNLLLSGYCNLILDLESVNTNGTEFLNVVVHIYKQTQKQNGTLKLCNINKQLGESLSYVFLDGVIPIFQDKTVAINDFIEESQLSNK